MRSMLNRALGLIGLVGIGFASTWITNDFSLSRHRLNSSDKAPSCERNVDEQLLHQTWILSQQGGQSHVFFSQNGQYVLKFFKDQPRPWLRWPAYQKQKNRKLERTLKGYLLLQQRCPQLSATCLLHLEKTHAPFPAILVDRLNIVRSVDLSSYLFVIQRRATALQKPVSLEDKEALVRQMLSLQMELAKQHIKDHDPRIHLNVGTLNGRFVIFDPGRIVEGEEETNRLPSKFYQFLEFKES